MAGDVNEHDKFVSIDIYTPTKSSFVALDQDGDGQYRDLNFTRSIFEYIGDGVDDFLAHDMLHSFNLNAYTTKKRNLG